MFYLTENTKKELASRLHKSELANPILGLSFGGQRMIDKDSNEIIKEYRGWIVNVFDKEKIKEVKKIKIDGIELAIVSSQFLHIIENKTLEYKNGKFEFF